MEIVFEVLRKGKVDDWGENKSRKPSSRVEGFLSSWRSKQRGVSIFHDISLNWIHKDDANNFVYFRWRQNLSSSFPLRNRQSCLFPQISWRFLTQVKIWQHRWHNFLTLRRFRELQPKHHFKKSSITPSTSSIWLLKSNKLTLQKNHRWTFLTSSRHRILWS